LETVLLKVLAAFEVLFLAFELKNKCWIKGIELGFEEREVGIKLKSLLTVFGDVTFNFKDGLITVTKPKFIFQNRIQLINYLKLKVKSIQQLVILLAVALIGCLLFTAKSILTKK